MKFFHYLLAIIFSWIFSNSVQAQFKGKITEQYTGTPIPFVHIITDSGKEFISDLDGNFEIRDTLVNSITFKKYLHRDLTIKTDTISKDLEIKLPIYLYFEFEKKSSQEGQSLIKDVLDHKKKNEISHYKHLRYSTYSKAAISSEKVEKTNRLVKKFFKFFSLKFKTFKNDQHFLLLESVTDKKVYNKFHYQEVITGAKSTILNVPSLFIQTTQLHSFTVYDDYIILGGKSYISPLANNTFARYSFTINDTIHVNGDTIYVVKFNPHLQNFYGLKGLMYINTKNYAVQYFQATPAKDKKIKMTALQSYIYYPEEKIWFPYRTKTVVFIQKSGEKYLANLDSYVSEVDLNYFSKKKDYDEVVLFYPSFANNQDSAFWRDKRLIPLNIKDKNTYAYYDSVDQKKYIQRTLQLGEDIYYGFIPLKKVDIDLRKILDFNRVENVRIGIGGNTNINFSDRYIIGGYIGYGIKDTDFKYGANLTYKLRTLPLALRTSFSNDLKESAGVFFPFNRNQYPSESLRRVNIKIMDKVLEWDNSVIIHPAKYIDIKTGLSISRNTPRYDYQFKDFTSNIFNYTEFSTGIRYAYGEQFIRLIDRKLPSSTPFPIFYFLYTKGFNNLLWGDFNYQKFDMKMEFTFKFLDYGTTGAQLIAGKVNGAVPYSKLYNETGSFKSFSSVVHNSFETMQYNEFLSDRYVSLFLSHDFGRVFYRSRFFTPRVILLQNFGWGSLSHPEYQKKIAFKTMEKGYFETGISLNNILTYNLSGLNIGLGPGFFLRYGPYANAGFFNNIAIKLAVRFGL